MYRLKFKEIIRKKYNNIKQETEEPVSIQTELPETSNLNSSEEVDDSLINNLLISDDEDDEISDDDSTVDRPAETMTGKFSDFLKAEALNTIESLKQKLCRTLSVLVYFFSNKQTQNT